ncbi:hypothetical protein PBY51_021148 [Eleginops maclovinus]|uniref:Uncharacterized protein n=1 Tax=Eleginops maclovinus TaxID=56733 RepID=A0AAN8ALR4_ELEMC|nr:hypothetical protein PBY51_021148 [Eleginops maclovinus]
MSTKDLAEKQDRGEEEVKNNLEEKLTPDLAEKTNCWEKMMLTEIQKMEDELKKPEESPHDLVETPKVEDQLKKPEESTHDLVETPKVEDQLKKPEESNMT